MRIDAFGGERGAGGAGCPYPSTWRRTLFRVADWAAGHMAVKKGLVFPAPIPFLSRDEETGWGGLCGREGKAAPQPAFSSPGRNPTSDPPQKC